MSVEDNVLKVSKVKLEDLDLSPELIAKLSVPYKTVESDSFRTVFLSFHFDSPFTEEAVAVRAINRLIVPELYRLHCMETGDLPAPDGFKILGCLAPPSIIKLVGPAAGKFIREWKGSSGLEYYEALDKCIAENKDVPPFTYAVFCFVTVAYHEPHCRLDDRVFRDRLDRLGMVNAQPEGSVGPKVVLED
jgi:hypothetical protein